MQDWLKYISIFSVTVPILLSVRIRKTDGLVIRLFYLLCIGLGTELIIEFGSFTRAVDDIIFHVYCLTECTFFFLIIGSFVDFMFKSFFKILFYISLPLWIFCQFVADPLGIQSGIALFNLLYEIVIAFLAVHVLLKFVERNEGISKSPHFWIILGIFFYCFCTFFMMSFLDTTLMKELWYTHNVINILTYILYSIGVWKVSSWPTHPKGNNIPL